MYCIGDVMGACLVVMVLIAVVCLHINNRRHVGRTQDSVPAHSRWVAWSRPTISWMSVGTGRQHWRMQNGWLPGSFGLCDACKQHRLMMLRQRTGRGDCRRAWTAQGRSGQEGNKNSLRCFILPLCSKSSSGSSSRGSSICRWRSRRRLPMPSLFLLRCILIATARRRTAGT